MSADAAYPLHALHRETEAEFQSYGEIEIVCTFGEPQAEYAAIRKGCAMMDMAHRGVLEVRGIDRLEFLNRFLTNALIQKSPDGGLRPLTSGEGVYAFLLSNKGRIVADMNVLERGDRTLLETDARNLENLHASLEKYVFSEKVTFVSPNLQEIALLGPRSAAVMAELFPGFTPLQPLGSTEVGTGDALTVVMRDDPSGVPGYFLLMQPESAAAFWQKAFQQFGDGGAIQSSRRQVWPCGWAAFNTTRIEAGRPLFGIDFDDHFLPAETSQLSRAVSLTKGCYLGQEIVARMHARGQCARQIVGLRMDESFLPMAGSPIYDDQQNQIGGITSSTISPILSNAAIALAVVKSAFAAPGTAVRVAAEGDIRIARVVRLPFLNQPTHPEAP